MPLTPTIDPGDGSSQPSGSYFNLVLNPYAQQVTWDAQGPLPILNAFSLGFQRNQVTDPYVEFWVGLSLGTSPLASITTNGMSGNVIDVSGSSKIIQPAISNFPSLPNGTYAVEIGFNAYAKNSSGVNTLFDSVSYVIYLEVFNNDAASITTEKSEYNLVFNRETNVLSGDTSVVLQNNTVPDVLTFDADYFVSKTGITTDFTLEGSNLATQPALPQSGLVTVNGAVKKAGNKIANVKIKLFMVNTSDIVADKTALSFQLMKSVPGTASQSFFLTNPENYPFTLTAPSWLTLSASSGTGSMSIIATTVNSSAIAGGVYTGEIVISYNGETLIIPVQLVVVAFVNLFLESGDNFCHDIPKVVFNKLNATARFVKVSLKSTYELMGAVTIVENVFQVPYINNLGEFALGDKVHSYFPEYDGNPFEMSGMQVFRKPALVEFKAEELDINFTSIHTETTTGIVLYPGKKPAGYPLLSSVMHRKTNGGNILFTSEIKNNRIEVNKIVAGATELPDFGTQTLNLYEFGKVYDPMHVVWFNQNLAPEWFTFTGSRRRSPEFSHIYSRNIWDGQNKKFGYTKNRTLSVETGFFMKVEEELIEQLLQSPLVYLRTERTTYKVFAVSPKLETDNTEDETIEKVLEFVIVEEYGN